MKLEEIPSGGIEIKLLSQNSQLTADIQSRLINLGVLDPPVDGDFGVVSRLALARFAKLVGLSLDEKITRPIARTLLESSADTMFPLNLGSDFASRIFKYMKLNNYWFARLPDFLTIVYIEGVDENGLLNGNQSNRFNDRRIVIGIKGNKPAIVGNWEATTEPGRKKVLTPENPKGAARIAFGQYKAWRVGIHKPRTPSQHEALVQVADVKVYRDLNKDFKRTGDEIDVGSSFGINQHKGFNQPVGDIGIASAGCLVGRTNKGHEEFMKLVKSDPRFSEASKGYRFMTTVIAGDDLQARVPA